MIDLGRLAGWMDGLGLVGKGEPIEHRLTWCWTGAGRAW